MTALALTDHERVGVVQAALGNPSFDMAGLGNTLTVTPDNLLPEGANRVVAANVRTLHLGSGWNAIELQSPPAGTTDNLEDSSFGVEYWLSAVPGKYLLFDVELVAAPSEGKSHVRVQIHSHQVDYHVANFGKGQDHLLMTAPPRSWGDSGLTYFSVRALSETSSSGGSIGILGASITGLAVG